jgi:hypothetical protein
MKIWFVCDLVLLANVQGIRSIEAFQNVANQYCLFSDPGIMDYVRVFMARTKGAVTSLMNTPCLSPSHDDSNDRLRNSVYT